MRFRSASLVAALCLVRGFAFPASIHYVNVTSQSPTPPYADWAHAAATIQDAIDLADVGDQILVTNGVYATGGRVVYGTLTNRVAATKAVTIQSVNGPGVTFIQGYQVPGQTNGDGAVRCVYLSDNALLSGFTLTNGATRQVYTDRYAEESGGGVWCESANGVVSNCVLIGNSAEFGGGAAYGTLTNCVLATNTASSGGGAFSSALQGCTLWGNFGGDSGGGAASAILDRCQLAGNSAHDGGGTTFCTAKNCSFVGNSAPGSGGASYYDTLNNCTVVNNTADAAGGASAAVLNNCILYYNSARTDPNFSTSDSTLNFCCAMPLPAKGLGNFTNAPGLMNPVTGQLQLVIGSPCINAGNNLYANGASDLAGKLRVVGDTVDVGAFEFQAHYADVNSPLPTPPYGTWATAARTIQEAIDVANPGEAIVVTNGVYQTGGRVVYGALTNRVAVTKAVSVQSVNGPASTIIRGYRDPGMTNGDTAVRCVYLTNGASLSGFTLAEGATRVAGNEVREQSGGGIFCETNASVFNCVLTNNAANQFGGGACGGRLTNCTLVGNSVGILPMTAGFGGGSYLATLENSTIKANWGIFGGGVYGGTCNGCSVLNNQVQWDGGGAAYATLTNCFVNGNRAFDGGAATQSTLRNCVVQANFATDAGGGANYCTLSGSTISGCATSGYGAGGYYSTFNNCVILSSQAGKSGGGAYGSTLNNCTLRYNWASTTGGGACNCALNNCTLTDNDSGSGGGICDGLAYNCIIYGNTPAYLATANYSGGSLNFCCTVPLPATGVANFTNLPLFVYPNSNLRLQSNSPCINAGLNSAQTNTVDLDGNPRISGGTIDVGAFEWQNPSSRIAYAWLQQYGWPLDGSADAADPDGDGMNNWQEWQAGTDPTDGRSVLRLFAPTFDASGVTVTWPSAAGRYDFLDRGFQVGDSSTFVRLQNGIAGQAGMTSYTDTTATGSNTHFYRVGVQP